MNLKLSHEFNSSPVRYSLYYLVLFVFWPFLAFILALTNYSQKESRKVVYFFLVYFGFTLVVITHGYNDSVGYAMNLAYNAKLPFSMLFERVFSLYSNDASMDVIEPLISFVISRFTDNYRVLFAVFAAIFGFFYLKSIDLLYIRYRDNPGWESFIHLAFFTVIIPITAINGFRFWTAAWMFFLGAYHVVTKRDAKYFSITLGAVFMHWSFISVNVLLLVYFLAGNRNYIYLPITIISFILPRLIAPALQSLSMILGGGLQGRINSYTNEDYMQVMQGLVDSAAWFMTLGNDLVFYYLIFAILIIKLVDSALMNEQSDRNLYSFLLLFLALINFGEYIPSFGTRFRIVFFLFATLYIFNYCVKIPFRKINLFSWVGLFPMLLYLVVTFRQASGLISIWLFSPGLGMPLIVPDLSIEDLLF